MAVPVLKRQFITDIDGRPIAVILPIEDYVRVKGVLEEQRQPDVEMQKFDLMKKAAEDPLFLHDLYEVMNDFERADSEWWEISE